MNALTRRLRLWWWNEVKNPILYSSFWLMRIDPIIAWIERVIYCHHNARVIADFERRMSVVLCNCTRAMSKPYYAADAMCSEINSYINERCDEAYDEGRKDALEEYGIFEEGAG